MGSKLLLSPQWVVLVDVYNYLSFTLFSLTLFFDRSQISFAIPFIMKCVGMY